jgi:hypothetical protein
VSAPHEQSQNQRSSSAAEAAVEEGDNYRSGEPLRHPKSRAKCHPKIKSNVKGSGQECPLHTSKITVKVGAGMELFCDLRL